MPKQPFVPVPRVLRVRFSGLHQSHPWVNGFAIQYDGLQPDNLALTNFAATLGSVWMSTFGGLLSGVTSLRLVQVWDISSDSASEGTDNTQHNGQSPSTNPLPVQSAVVISWPVNKRWRGGHFRTYLPARTLTDITNGSTLATGIASTFAAAATSFKNTVNQEAVAFGPVRLGGVRYYPTGMGADGKPVLKTSGEFLWYGDAVCRSRLDSQRRRLGKELV